jgi:CheY-like chemotaxis protein
MKERKKPLVFIVEDNKAYRILIGRLLQRKGFMVMMFENGRKALDMLRYVKPQLVLSDIQMPVMDGFEFHEHINEEFPKSNIPFIYLSSTQSEIEIQKATELGATGMLGKPVSPDTLTQSIDKVLGITTV